MYFKLFLKEKNYEKMSCGALRALSGKTVELWLGSHNSKIIRIHFYDLRDWEGITQIKLIRVN
jgi:aspartyl-tRNA synthetase